MVVRMKGEKKGKKKKIKKNKQKFLYDKINNDQWEIMEYLHYNMGTKKPEQLSSRKIAIHLDWKPEKATKNLVSLKNKKLISSKKLFLTSFGKKVKKSYEKKYDPDY